MASNPDLQYPIGCPALPTVTLASGLTINASDYSEEMGEIASTTDPPNDADHVAWRAALDAAVTPPPRKLSCGADYGVEY